jgi:tRNA nucleotidyltransferase (CCA-adding enzyme)
MSGQEHSTAGMTVITTHINADFDALASLLAAQKLYPDARIVFPGSQEKNLKNFFINSLVYLFNLTDLGAIDFARISRLVLVDTRQPGRIGKLAALLEMPGVEIHIYDHHPAKANDIAGDLEVCEPTGANVTLLVEAIRDRKIEISPEEATIMCLGLYEDTGSFTYPSTTEKDFRAAAFLLSQGANLNIVSDLIARELRPEQVTLLNDMIQAATRRNINGIEVVLTSISRETYIPDFAFLVQKMARMENLDALFALALMESKVYIVARSRIEEVDVAAVLSPLGGGGHAYAAAAAVKNQTLAQTETQLMEILIEKVRARRLARNLMSSPAIVVAPEVTCEEASGLLTRYNVNALLVTAKADGREELCGYITRQVIEKALFHKLGAVPVREYMTSEVATVSPEADLAEIQRKIIDHKQRILPVISGDSIAGVLTRTDLLNILVGQRRAEAGSTAESLRESFTPRTRNVTKFMLERIPAGLISVLKNVGAEAGRLGYGAFAVGGFVRDLFLYRADEDLDIVIEGDGVAFAKSFARATGARVHTHEKFGTAVIVQPDGFKIDVASARMEYYKFPAALPVVEMSSIKLDLYRRDFTINTLAIHLNPDRFGALIDFFNAQKDLKEKAIRVLHNLSFVEDPTRVFRAIRFEQRFGFSISRLTAGLIDNAVSMNFFRELSGRRIFGELRQILEEENPVAAILRLNDFDLLKVIHPSLGCTPALVAMLNRTRQVLSWKDLLFLDESYMKWAVYFLVLLHHCERGKAQDIVTRFELTPRLQKLFLRGRADTESCLFWLERSPSIDNSELYHRLVTFRTELILYMMAATEQERIQKAISLYFTNLRHVGITLKGEDLKALGLKPGPVYREVFKAVFDAKLKGLIKTHADELELAAVLARKRQTASGRPQAADHKRQTTSGRPQAADHKRQTTSGRIDDGSSGGPFQEKSN